MPGIAIGHCPTHTYACIRIHETVHQRLFQQTIWLFLHYTTFFLLRLAIPKVCVGKIGPCLILIISAAFLYIISKTLGLCNVMQYCYCKFGCWQFIHVFIPQCHGNRLVIGGVHLRYMRDYLMGSQLTIGFTDNALKANWLPNRHGQWGIK